MGAKAGLVYLGEGLPSAVLQTDFRPDPARSAELAGTVLGGPVRTNGVRALTEGGVWPERGTICVAAWEEFALIGYHEICPDRPSEIGTWIKAVSPTGSAYGVFMHSVVDFGAFAVWEAGELRRSVSLSADSGIMEDIGTRYSFEAPFWAGDRGLAHAPDYPLPFHPLDLAEEALLAFFGFGIERSSSMFTIDADSIVLPAFRLAE
ncbi:DUF6928 family protein [Glycomyces buryatensis]|uniref:Uncharacterized protein n=1 Tax=Glycomyces buryatensis TaxID=2570927 RepID=A0A4S8QNC3_9ACTN|nr:hypothetical protein [Glycomyces buryatensis]THV42224.1 hypothetical protein FAB82_07395 [Glycomyces buryatensis]